MDVAKLPPNVVVATEINDCYNQRCLDSNDNNGRWVTGAPHIVFAPVAYDTDFFSPSVPIGRQRSPPHTL